MSDSAETPSSPVNGTVTLPVDANSPPEGANPSHPSPPLSVLPSTSVDFNNGTAIAPSNDNDGVTPSPPASPPPISNSPPPSPLPSSPPPSSLPPSPPLSSNTPPSNSEPPSATPSPPSFSPPPSSSESPPLRPPHSPHSPPPSTNGTLTSPPPAAEGFTSPPPTDLQQSPSPPLEQHTTPPSPIVPNAPPNSSVLSPPPSAETIPTQSRTPSPPVSSGSPSNSSSTSSATKTSTGSSSSTAGTGTGSGSSDNGSGTTTTTKTVAGTLVAGVLLITIIALFFVVRRRKKRRDIYGGNYMPPPNNFTVKTEGYYYGQQPQSMGYSGQANYSNGSQPSNHGDSFRGPDSWVLGRNKSYFSYDELMEITNGFSRQNIIGEGGFGYVFKGLMADGKEVAVKQLKAGSGQGNLEFKAEVEIFSRVHHRHLVSLVGYCISENQRLLIYEFVPNKTLEHHLHTKGMPLLDWPKRLKIAIGSAKGLAYLHEDCHPKIIHRDIKSANILLDDDFEAQVADFGLARLNDTTQTHVSTRVMGTFGYLAPEYASSGKLTDRSDVYSFGVVLLELITGRKPVDPTQPLGDESLVEWARPLLIQAIETGDLGELVDPKLEKHYVESEMLRMVEIAAACVRHSAPKRPRMVQVVRALDSAGELSDLSNGVKYGQSTVYDSGQRNQDIMKFRRMALGSGDSSEFSAYSGEYTSRNISHGPLTSGDYASSESKTRAMNRPHPEQKYGGNQGNYGGFI